MTREKLFTGPFVLCSLGFSATYATAAGVIVLGSALFAGWDRRR